MKAFICLSLLLVCAFSQYEGVESQVNKLSQHRWGKLLVEIAELHTLAKGPLQDLVDHLQKLVSTSTANRAAEQKSYDNQENQHVKQVDYLKNQIRRAQTDIINTNTKLQNVLRPLKKQLINNIAVLRENIRKNLATQAKERQERSDAHNVFLGIQSEHRDAIAALDQALRVVDALRNPSLVQVHILRVHLTRIENALRSHDKYEPLIESLVEMSTLSKLKDINAIRGVIKLLNELRESIVNALNEFTRIENAAIAAYNERMTQLGDELRMFQSALARDVQDLAETIKRIKESVLFVQVRTVDLRNRRNELKAENARWVAVTGLHDQFQKDITEEIDAASAALSILRNANFASWLSSRLRA